MESKLTAVYEKVKDGYIGYVAELPGANTQGITLEETKNNLKEAISLVLEANRLLNQENIQDESDIVMEEIGLVSA